ncbi:shTK domain protein [Ancylostoma ceylanicum]|uniref:ShTK domain protein n=1 Tax=Ancylostoma ceylanicum TaxID=53326 RepID=A0A0D6LIV6_9BILA|nr:shTK domain protein [Ancylostoma ceylanicum]
MFNNRIHVYHNPAEVFVAASSSVVTAEFLSCGNGAESNCCDKHESCAEWARNNECENNPEWMLPNCQLSCHSCETHTSQCGTGRESNCCDQHPSCASWAQQGECQNNPEWMLPNCPLSCHNCDSDEATTDPSMCGTGKESNCCDKHPSCASWAQQGECQNNPEWMLPNCQLSCHSCETESDEPSTETSMCGTGNESNCCDKHPNCAFWARRRECKSNPDWMLPNCPLSCRNCGTDFDKQTTKSAAPVRKANAVTTTHPVRFGQAKASAERIPTGCCVNVSCRATFAKPKKMSRCRIHHGLTGYKET